MAARKRPLPARFKVQISSLEADVAFCNALITFAGQIPETIYQRAEIRVYRTLERVLRQRLEMARQEARERVEKLSA
jgi:hypothetical protein